MEIATVDRVARIRALNDAFRTTFAGGVVTITDGIAALNADIREEVLLRVRRFKTFTVENDPHEEHDFGSFTIGRQKFFWKISYYDRSTFGSGPDYGSENPADPRMTTRVMTVMLAEEY